VTTGGSTTTDPLWYKDAIIYQLHVKAFFDSDNDGVGDFKGLTQRLDYIKDLGVTAIWLMPFYPSPTRDDGYDISEYKGVHPEYGTLRDARAFVRKAHELGLKVITELVINHTSDEHPWFQRARRAPRGSSQRDFYVWSDTTDRYADTPIIFSDTESSNWEWDEVAGQYYWHRFFHHQPDLNHDNPQVFKAIMSVMRFWLDAGVDGLRLDAIPYLIEREGTDNQNLPETHTVLKKMRAEMDERYDGRSFLAEANQWPEDVLPYFGDGDECHMAFHFPLMPRMYMAVAQEDRHPIVEIVHQTPEIPENCQWAVFLRNHDELTLEMVTDRERDYMYETYANDPRMRVNVGIRRRLAPMMENDRPRIELLNSLLFSMPGTPVVYYGDEIGMGDNIFLGDRDTVRTPMQWTSDRNAGFSRAEPARLYLPPIMDPVYGYASVNVESQGRSAGSLLNWMKRMIAVRKAHQAFGRGTLQLLHPGNRKVLAYLREYGDDSILCVANLSRSAQPVELDLSRFRGRVPVELLGGSAFPPPGNTPYLLTLPGHGFLWFRLAAEVSAPSWHEGSPPMAEPPVLVLPSGTGRETVTRSHRAPLQIPPRQIAQLENEALPDFLPAHRWFPASFPSGRPERVSIEARADLGSRWMLTILRVEPGGETFFAPFSAAWEDEGPERVEALRPYTAARLRRRSRIGILYDALADEEFCRHVVDAMGEERTIPFDDGELRLSRTKSFEGLTGEEATSPNFRRAGYGESNTSVILDERLVLKAYRRLTDGAAANPEPEMVRHLAEMTSFDALPPLAGTAVLARPDREDVPLALLRGYVPDGGDGWNYFANYLNRYLQEHLTTSWIPEEDREAQSEVAEARTAEDAYFDDLVDTLGRRTGELHAALAAPTEDPAFAPEPADGEEVARWGQTILRDLDETLEILARGREGDGETPEAARAAVDGLLGARDAVAEAFIRRARAAEGASVLKTRYHGDYHLGRVLLHNNDFVVSDFEGRPGASPEEKRDKHSPLRDVAAMLRSFDYAARAALRNLGAEKAQQMEEIEAEVLRWKARARETFLEGYRGSAPEALGGSSELLDLFELERALHELRHERESRPDWLDVPARALLEIAGSRAESA
jgi:maltose alpha-D-glucosyltransferase / alpha-amylase